MSTSATQPGTTTRAGRSGKGLGIAAAALAVVIAAGFVFAVNQGNEVAESVVQSGPAQIAAERHAERVRLLEAAALAATRPDPSAEIDRLNELAVKVRAESHPGFNIEKTKMDLASQVAVVNEHPGLNPEKTRMDMLIDKLDERIYVPSIVLPKVASSYWSEGNLDLRRAQAQAQQPTELKQPEWDNRMP
jgi:hypothetical protein